MKNLIGIVINVIHVFSLCISMLVWVAGIIYEIVGPGKFERMFSAIGIPNAFGRFWLIGSIALILSIITYCIKSKYSF